MAHAQLPTSVAMPRGEVQLVWTNLSDLSSQSLADFESIVTADELVYVSSAMTDAERKLRLVSRGILREELAKRTATVPASVHLKISATGKPYLGQSLPIDEAVATDCNFDITGTVFQGGLHFNVSHSSDWLVHAFALGFEIGIDLEKVDVNLVNEELIAGDDDERLAWAALPIDQRVVAFFDQWVAREAIAKATGNGLVSMLALPEQKKELGLLRDHWLVLHLPAPLGFRAALAAPKHVACLS